MEFDNLSDLFNAHSAWVYKQNKEHKQNRQEDLNFYLRVRQALEECTPQDNPKKTAKHHPRFGEAVIRTQSVRVNGNDYKFPPKGEHSFLLASTMDAEKVVEQCKVLVDMVITALDVALCLCTGLALEPYTKMDQAIKDDNVSNETYYFNIPTVAFHRRKEESFYMLSDCVKIHIIEGVANVFFPREKRFIKGSWLIPGLIGRRLEPLRGKQIPENKIFSLVAHNTVLDKGLFNTMSSCTSSKEDDKVSVVMEYNYNPDFVAFVEEMIRLVESLTS